MTKLYDFIVVGAGPAGCTVARRIADSKKKPSVLLIEAGSDNRVHQHYRSAESRFTLAFTQPDLDWQYSTIEQAHWNNRKINHARGKGLGGSTGTNFSAWLIGADEDFNDWASLTGDDAWRWPAVWDRLTKIENAQRDVEPELKAYLEPFNHSTTGNVGLTYAKVANSNLEKPSFEAAKMMGWPANHDINSGNPIGLGISPATFRDGLRVSAAEAYLANIPTNLTILPDTPVSKILIENKKAVGVAAANGQEYYATHDVILSSGALNTPQLLMLSGIGLPAELSKHGIPTIHTLPGVGQHLLDHVFAPITQILTPEAAAASVSPNTDPVHQLGTQICIGFLQLPTLPTTPEFQSLPPETQTALLRPTVPHFEIAVLGIPINPGPSYTPNPNDHFRSHICFLMNLQSTGTVTLTSSSPTDPPRIDSNYFASAYDRRLAIEALRAVHTFANSAPFAATTARTTLTPTGTSDDELLAYWREYASSVWHMSGTVKMGRVDDPDELACVTPDFRVKGMHGLRVVDLSICPTLPCNHPQSTAYLVGETAAEKIVREYGLDL